MGLIRLVRLCGYDGVAAPVIGSVVVLVTWFGWLWFTVFATYLGVRWVIDWCLLCGGCVCSGLDAVDLVRWCALVYGYRYCIAVFALLVLVMFVGLCFGLRFGLVIGLLWLVWIWCVWWYCM